VLDDLQATGDVRVTLLETDQTIDSHRSGKQVSIRVPIRLPERSQRARRTYCGLKG
jgi:hypothetical protein